MAAVAVVKFFEEIKERVETRLAVCNECEHKTKISTCALCGCQLHMKAAVKTFRCPAGKWLEH